MRKKKDEGMNLPTKILLIAWVLGAGYVFFFMPEYIQENSHIGSSTSSLVKECHNEGGVMEGKYCVVGDKDSSNNLFQIYCQGSGKGLKYYSNTTYELELNQGILDSTFNNCIIQKESGLLQ